MTYTSAGRKFSIERRGQVWVVRENGRVVGEAISPDAAERLIDQLTGVL